MRIDFKYGEEFKIIPVILFFILKKILKIFFKNQNINRLISIQRKGEKTYAKNRIYNIFINILSKRKY